MPTVAPARKAAFDILLTVEKARAHADHLLRGKLVSSLSTADKHLATALVLGTLRWQIWLDRQIVARLDRPGAKLDSEVRIALRLGAFQLLRMDRIPAHATIDESVDLAKNAGHRFASRMVNAVLRKLAASARETNTNPEEAYPAWMVERWRSRNGVEATQAICAFGQSEPAMAIRLVDPSREEELRQAGIELEPGQLLKAAQIVTRGDVTTTPAFREDPVRIQDEGSQLVAEIAGRGQRILDACAAPGGKTLVLAERNPGAEIIACEISPQRLAGLRERVALLSEQVECRLGDATQLGGDSACDLVLADVPCSGTGTLGRNPEIRHRLQPEDLPRHSERQAAILHAALRATRPGGRIVYSTCSLEPEENEAVVAAVLEQHRELRVASIHRRLEEMESEGVLVEQGKIRLYSCITPEGYLRLMPGIFATDGFFVALLEKATA